MEKQSAATAQEEKAEQMEKINSLPRKAKRASLRIRHGANRQPFARFRSGIPTGTTAHFRAWMADLSVRSAMERLKLNALAESAESKVAGPLAMLYVGGFKSVWDVARADVNALLAVRGIGPAGLDHVETYLKARNVKLAWTVN